MSKDKVDRIDIEIAVDALVEAELNKDRAERRVAACRTELASLLNALPEPGKGAP